MTKTDNKAIALNESQQQAVETINGPVMVIAGPGTGKTQVIAERVASILKKTDMRPSNILCLTYTVSGATAMRERLRSIIGADAYGVTITTIHGFCNDIIQDYPDVFSDFTALQQVTDVRRFQIVNKIIDQEIPLDSALINPKDRYGRTKDILSRISQCKREGKTLEDLQAIIPIYTAEMEGKSRDGTKAHARNVRVAKQYEEFVTIFAHYQEAMALASLYDYEDMILYVIDALKEESWLTAGLQERYQYVLVDEYQDTNGAQNIIIDLLTTVPDGVDEPNVFVVGDDDQAIYRFQGANVQSMLHFYKRFSDCTVITLTENYRSTQNILDVSGSLIANNKERLINEIDGLSKDLHAASDREGISTALLRPASDAIEAFAITEQLKHLHEEGIPWNEIAILTRTNAELFTFKEILGGNDIPVQLSGKLNLLENEDVQNILALLRAINDIEDDTLVAGALQVSYFGIHPADLGTIFAAQREERTQRKEEGKPRKTLMDYLCMAEERKDEWSVRNMESLTHGRDILLRLHHQKGSVTVAQLLEQVLHDTIAQNNTDLDPLTITVLQEFFDHVKSRAMEASQYTIGMLLEDLAYRETYGISLQYAIPHITDDGVQLMTAHGAKGLEFDSVIIPGFREKHWGNKSPPRSMSFPDHLLFSQDESKTAKLEDERRLCYVAWTRAKRRLILSCPERTVRGEREQDASPSQFFAEGEHIVEQQVTISDPEHAQSLLLEQKSIPIDDQLKTFIRKRLETFKLSVSSLNKFLADPQKFLWEDLLRIPQAQSIPTVYGNAVHNAMLAWGRHHAAGYSKESLITTFRDAVADKGILSSAEEASVIYLGETALDRYYDERLQGANPQILALEKSLSAHLGEIPLTGKLDRIDLYSPEGKNVHVIDYKTGKPKTEKQIREERDGAMFRQLVFYKLLGDLSSGLPGYEITELSLEFIGEREDEPRTVTFTITEEEINELREVIVDVWKKIHEMANGEKLDTI